MMTCVTDYSVITNEDIVIAQETGRQEEQVTRVVVDYYVQPEKPEDLDVLVILDTSCSMSDNFENVSIGLDILRDDIEVLTFDYQMALINSSLRENYYVGPIGPDTSSMEIFIDVWIEDSLSGEKTKCNEAIYTFVAVDNMGKPVKVPEVTPETKLEKLRYDGALRRRQLSLILAGKIKANEATELKALFN